MNTLLIAGTDTDAGKTVVTTALVAHSELYHPGSSVGLMKLIQTGSGDREWYEEIFAGKAEIVTPLHYKSPLAPPIAAALEDRPVPLEILWQALEELRSRRERVFVESLGGLGSPVTRELTVADIAAGWRLPTLLVAPVRLGAIGAIVAHVALARQVGVPLLGIALNCVEPRTEREIEEWAEIDLIRSLTGYPVLGVMPFLENRSDLRELASVVDGWEVDRWFV